MQKVTREGTYHLCKSQLEEKVPMQKVTREVCNPLYVDGN